MDRVASEILLGLWKVHLLHHAAEGRVYGNEMLVELRRHGYDVSPGTLYPILQRMERHGWLRLDGSGEGGRKTYVITAAGREVLELVRQQVGELHEELAHSRASARRSGRRLSKESPRAPRRSARR
jgi:PadR family transcriptional regulator, regulatory protein PadR